MILNCTIEKNDLNGFIIALGDGTSEMPCGKAISIMKAHIKLMEDAQTSIINDFAKACSETLEEHEIEILKDTIPLSILLKRILDVVNKGETPGMHVGNYTEVKGEA